MKVKFLKWIAVKLSKILFKDEDFESMTITKTKNLLKMNIKKKNDVALVIIHKEKVTIISS